MAPDPLVTLDIEGTWNARDAGSLTGLRPGVLFRTATLSGLSDAGRDRLRALGVTDVVDLRSDAEVAHNGADAPPEGVRVHRLAIAPGARLSGQDDSMTRADRQTQLIEQLRRPGAGEALMADVYRHIATDTDAVACLGEGLNLLADERRVLAVHCSAGKDRTGVFVAFAATIAGAAQGAIDTDFLYSNHAIEDQLAVVRIAPGMTREMLAPFLGVSLDSLRAAQQAVQDTFGSLGGFLSAAGVSEQAADRIRARLNPAHP